jgi:hypothetical protein
MQDLVGKETRRYGYSPMPKKFVNDAAKHNSFTPLKTPSLNYEEKKVYDPGRPKSSEDRLSSLKNYRKSRGLCFKCGEVESIPQMCQYYISEYCGRGLAGSY